MSVNNPNIGVTFGIVVGAGVATAAGAAVVFFPSLVKLASRRVLASALGVSAGVITYVSFMQIFQKSNDGFLDVGFSEIDAQSCASLYFFGGVIIMLLSFTVFLCMSTHEIVAAKYLYILEDSILLPLFLFVSVHSIQQLNSNCFIFNVFDVNN
uniref:Uncharacterized protein n=1 Tax=Ditylum brightwellii TaxID=49249 RepID=A0A7S4QRE8_9STRA